VKKKIIIIGAGSGRSRLDAFWREVGALPCEMVETTELASAVSMDGEWFHDYYDLEKLESHLKRLSPDDAVLIDEYLTAIRRFMTKSDPLGAQLVGTLPEKLASLPFFMTRLTYFRQTLESFGARFKHPLLRRAFPLLHSSVPQVPLFMHLVKHSSTLSGDLAWPRGGSLTIARNMAAHYERFGGAVHYGKKVTRILTENDRACGVELEDGTRHRADFVVSNADGRKTIRDLLGGRYVNGKIAAMCAPNPDVNRPFAVHVFLGVKRDLSAYPGTLIVFLDRPASIAGHVCDHLHLQVYGFDPSMASAGKGVIKAELFSRESYFARLASDADAYQAEKRRVADQVISLLEKVFPGLREDVEEIDVPTLRTWERFMGGTGGCDNFPNRPGGPDVLGAVLGLGGNDTLPGLKNFFFAGSWVTSAGALLMNALAGRTAVKKICRRCERRFR
jgi:phytoene dehydrogenase-like protein